MKRRFLALVSIVAILLGGFSVVQAGSHWQDWYYIEGESAFSYTVYSDRTEVTWNSYTYSHDVEAKAPDWITLEFYAFRDGTLMDSGCPPAFGTVYLGDGGLYPEDVNGTVWDMIASHSATYGRDTIYESSYDEVVVPVSSDLHEVDIDFMSSRKALVRDGLIARYTSRMRDLRYELIGPFTELIQNPFFDDEDKNSCLIHLLCAQTLPDRLRIGDPKPGVAMADQDTVYIVLLYGSDSHELLTYRWSEDQWTAETP